MTGDRLGGRGWVVVGLAVALLLVAVTWFLAVGPTRADAADLRANTADVEVQNSVTLAKITTLKREAQHRRQLADQVRTALDGLPPGTHLPAFSNQLADQATARGVALTGFSVGAATVPGGDAAAASATPATAPLLAIPVTLTSTGPALAQLFFLRDIQEVGPRLALVTSTSLAPGPSAADANSIVDSSTLTVQLTVFSHRLPSATRDRLAGLLGDASTS